MTSLSTDHFQKSYGKCFDAVLLLSEEQVILCANGEAEKLLGKEIVGKSFAESGLTLEEGLQRVGKKQFELRSEGSLLFLRDTTQRHTLQRELQSSYIALDTLSRAGSGFILSKNQENHEEIFAELLTGIESVCRAEEGALSSYSPNVTFEIGSAHALSELPAITKLTSPKNSQLEGGEYLLGIPLISRGEVIGALVLLRRDTPFTSEHIQLILPMLQMTLLLIEGCGLAQEREEARKAALAANSAKSTFLANMSHEIRTPLNSVMGMIELLIHSDLDSKQEKLAHKAYKSSKILLHLLNEILDLSKIEARQLTLEHIPYHFPTIVEEALDMCLPKAEKKGLKTQCILSPDIKKVTGDPTRMRQVLTNLLTNAIKFTESGSVTLTAAIDQQSLLVTVKDTGIGIKEERQKQIFDAFTQEDSATTRKFGGSGLGLAISKQIVEQMQGEIGLRSEPDVGSEFWFQVPL